MKTDLYGKEGKVSSQIDLNDQVWGEKLNVDVVSQCVNVFLANSRKSASHAKTRGDVSGGGRKPWKQKGTGRARAGSSRSPIWYKGGVTFAPNGINWKRSVNKKVVKKAISMILSDRLSDSVVKFISFSDADSTKVIRQVLSNLVADIKSVLVISDLKNVKLGLRNMEGVTVVNPGNMNIFNVLSSEVIVIDGKALNILEKNLENGKESGE